MSEPFVYYKRYIPNPYRDMEEDEEFNGIALRCLLGLGFLVLILVLYRDLFYKEITGTVVSQQRECSLFIDTDPISPGSGGGKYYSEWVDCNRIIGHAEWQNCRSKSPFLRRNADCNKIIGRSVKNHARVDLRWRLQVSYRSPLDGRTDAAIVYVKTGTLNEAGAKTDILAHRLIPGWALSPSAPYIPDRFWYTRLPLDDLYRGDV